MKKYLSASILFLAVFSLLTVVAVAAANGNYNDVVYVNGTSGGGNGSSPDSAVTTIDTAYSLLNNHGGTIVVCGNTTISESYTFPAKSGTVWITGSYGGVNYEPTITLAGSKKMYLQFQSPVGISHLHFDGTNTAGCIEFFSGPSLTFGDGLSFTHNGGLIDTNPNGRIGVRIGNPASACENATFTMNSGRISYVQGGNNKQSVVNSTINFGGTAELALYLQGGGTNKNVTNSIINISGGTVPTLYANGYGTANLSTSVINLTGGNVGEIKDARPGSTGRVQNSVDINMACATDCVGNVLLSDENTIVGAKRLALMSGRQEELDWDFSKWDNVSVKDCTRVDLTVPYSAPSASLVIDEGSKLVLHSDSALPSTPAVLSGCIELYEAAPVVFLSGQGNDHNDGLSASAPVLTFETAAEKLQNRSGTIVICGNKTISSTYTFPSNDNKIVVTGKLGGTTYSSQLILAGTSKLYIQFLSDYEFRDIVINKINTGGCTELFSGSSLSFGDGVQVQVNGGAVGSNSVGVRLGRKDSYCAEASFTMRSGTVSYVMGGNNFYDVGSSTIRITGSSIVKDHVQGGGTGRNVAVSHIEFSGGETTSLYLNGYGAANLGESNVLIRGGSIKAIETQRTTGGVITGGVGVTFDGVTPCGVELSNESIRGSKMLTLSNMNGCVWNSGFQDWDSVAISNESTVYLRSAYGAPGNLYVDGTSSLVLNQANNSLIPAFLGGGTVRLGSLPQSGNTYEARMLVEAMRGTYGTGSRQGTAAYENYLLQFYDTGTCDIYDLSSSTPGTPTASIKLASYNTGTGPDGSSNGAYKNHANQAMFGNVKYDESDPFPLVYVLGGNSGDQDGDGYIGRCKVERITCRSGMWSSQLVQTIIYCDNGYSAPYDSLTGKFTYQDNPNAQFVNTNGYEKFGWGWPAFFVDSSPTAKTENKIYIFSARFRTTTAWEANNKRIYGISSYFEDNAYIITEFPLPALPASEADFGQTVTLYPTDILSQFSTDFDVYGTQGGTLYQGKIYYSFGFGGTELGRTDAVRVFDLAEQRISARIDLSDSAFYQDEPECCFIYGGDLGLSIINGKMYLIDYDETP